MRVQMVSDLHLEFPGSGGMLDIKNVDGKTDLLILGGDICVARKAAEFIPFFAQCADRFPHVVYIAGNHEFYHDDIDEAHDKLRAAVVPFGNVRYLNNEAVTIGGQTVFGSTLWTDCGGSDPLTLRMLAGGMNDFRLIKWKARKHWKLRPEDTVELHNEAVGALLETLIGTDEPIIVASHHAPTRHSIHQRYERDTYMNKGYHTDLEPLLERWAPQIALWTHGHVHDSFDYVAQGVRVVCNPRGYVTNFHLDAENPNFDIGKVVELA